MGRRISCIGRGTPANPLELRPAVVALSFSTVFASSECEAQMVNTNGYKVDLSNCDREPIHIPGKIQPHGVLIGFDPNTELVEVVSKTIEKHLGIVPLDAIGKKSLPSWTTTSITL